MANIIFRPRSTLIAQWTNSGKVGKSISLTVDFRLIQISGKDEILVDTLAVNVPNTKPVDLSLSTGSYDEMLFPPGRLYALEMVDSESGLNLGKGPIMDGQWIMMAPPTPTVTGTYKKNTALR